MSIGVASLLNLTKDKVGNLGKNHLHKGDLCIGQYQMVLYRPVPIFFGIAKILKSNIGIISINSLYKFLH